MSDETFFDEIWVSGTYTSVFFSEREVSEFLDSLLEKNSSPPPNLNVAFMPRKLIKPYTRREILNASTSLLCSGQYNPDF